MAIKLNFITPEGIEFWLQGKPVEWAQVIVVRTALRVLPLVGRVYQTDNLSGGGQDQLISSTIRACLTSSSARRYPAEDMVVAVARAASSSAFAAGAASASASAAFAAHAASSSAHAATFAARAATDVAFAARAATDAVAHAATDAVAHDEIWKNISYDANWLASRPVSSSAAEIIMSTRLWPDGEPEFIHKERSEFTHALMDHSKHHLVWINWYLRIIMGKPFFDLSAVREKELTLNIAKQENEFWERDFAEISKDISEWLEEARIWDAGDAEQRRLGDEEQVRSFESNSTDAKTSNPKTKPAIQLVDQSLLQVCTDIEAIKSISTERLESMPLKPNSGEALEDWNKQREIITIIKEKSAAISMALQAIEKHNDRSLAISETTSLLDELFQEFESFVRTNKKELVDNIVRIPSAILLCGLANLVGASMITATPAIFAMVGGEKMYNLLTKKNGKSDK